MDELPLRRVPEAVVRARRLPLRARVDVLARVGGVERERVARPVVGGGERVVVVGRVVAEVVGELAADDELLEEALDRGAVERLGLGRLDRGALGRELPEVEVGREARERAGDLWEGGVGWVWVGEVLSGWTCANEV